jgi:hypothetical protein
MKQVE